MSCVSSLLQSRHLDVVCSRFLQIERPLLRTENICRIAGWKLVLLAAGVALSGCGCGKKPAVECDFVCKWPRGRQSSYLIEVREQVGTCTAGRQIVDVQKVYQAIEANLSVSAREDGSDKTAEMVIVAASVERTISDGKRPATCTRRSLPGVVGARVQWHIDAGGRIKNAEGIDAFMKQVINDSQLANETLAAVFNEDFLNKARIAGVVVLPEGPARPGHRWVATDRVYLADVGTFLLRRRLHFEKWEMSGDRSCARIVWLSDVGKIIDEGAGKDILRQSIQKGEGWGWCLFSPALGTVVQWYEETRLTTRLDVPGTPRSSPGITQDIYRSIDVKLEGVEDTKEGSGRLLGDKKVGVSIKRDQTIVPVKGRPAKQK